MEVVLDGNSLSIEQLCSVAREGASVSVSPEARAKVQRSREVIERGVADFVEPVHRRRQHEAAAGRRRRAPKFPNRHVLSPRHALLQRSILSFFRHVVNRCDACA